MAALQRCRVAKGSARSIVAIALGLVIALSAPAPASAQFFNITDREFKLGILEHDANFLQGKERGVDINPEFIFGSPMSDSFAANLPWYLAWTAQARPTIGAEINTAGFTNQAYFGATWTWQLASNVFMPGDGITGGFFFGGAYNDGQTSPTRSDRKALGSNLLFREALELGYRITPQIEISAYLDHVSNAGLARYNQSINDVGGRIGFRF